MKRVFSLFIVFTLLFTILVGCKKEENTPSFNEAELRELSVSYCEQMDKGDFEQVYEALTEKNKTAVPKETLKQSWDQNVSSGNNYTEIAETTYVVENNMAAVSVVINYNGQGRAINFVYNTDKKLEGLNFTRHFIKPALTTKEKIEEREITVGDGDRALFGILTLPKEQQPKQVVLLVHGSGPNDLNETIGQNKMFEQLAHYLAEQGIASVRYNKRYCEHPELSTSEPMTVENEVLQDVTSAVKLIKSTNEVKDSKLVLVGHSLGGMLSPKIAKDNPEIEAIASLGGSPRHLADIVYDQNIMFIEALPDQTKEEKDALLSQAKAMSAQAKAVSEDKKDSVIPILGVTEQYWYSMNQIDIPALSKELTVPVLIMQGGSDFQVTKADYTAWQNAFKGNKNVTFKWYDKLNHIFMVTNGKKDVTEYQIKGELDTAFLKDLNNWIKKL